MYVRPRRLTPLQTRALGVVLVLVGALLALSAVSAEQRGGDHSVREGIFAPVCLLVGPWLALTGTWGAPTLPDSPRWHRAIAIALTLAGFVWGATSFAENVASWTR